MASYKINAVISCYDCLRKYHTDHSNIPTIMSLNGTVVHTTYKCILCQQTDKDALEFETREQALEFLQWNRIFKSPDFKIYEEQQ